MDSFKIRVAIISFHNALNYGAALQAYALQKVLIERINVDAEYIDYENAHRYELYNMRERLINAVKNRNYQRAIMTLIGSPLMFVRRNRFNRFYCNSIVKTGKKYCSSEQAKELNSEFDKFIVGSDQVWNNVNNGSDFAYLLDFVNDDRKKISYSSSFGLASIPHELLDGYRSNLSSFYRLAVREEKGVELVKELTGRKAHLVLDPVFLLDDKEWEQITCKSYRNSYLFCYVDSSVELDDFRDVCSEMTVDEFHVLCSNIRFSDVLNRKIKTRVSMSPEQFLSEIKNANYVLTDSFHCLAFCIIFHVPFTVILTGNQGKDERLMNLLKITGLQDRIYTPDRLINMSLAIDYENVDIKIKPYREYSMNYLEAAVLSKEDIGYMDLAEEPVEQFMCEDDRCTGCSACAAVCPVQAIEMRESSEGFLYPYRNKEKCINCKRCHSVCQVFDSNNKNNEYISERWAIKAPDEIRKESSSGGAFTLISDYILSHDGYICSAIFDQERYILNHRIINTAKDRDDMRGTYYIQSSLLDKCFTSLKELLENNKLVLFVGTACQVKGLRMYLGKEYNNLFCCDIICHGVASPKVFKEYVIYLEKDGKIENIKCRDKSLGWRGYTESVILNGSKKSRTLKIQSFDNLFSHSVINRRCCAGCRFANLQRPGDITIGDCWGIEKKAPSFEDDLGVSLVICSTSKGVNLLNSINNVEKISLSSSDCIQNSLKSATLSSKYRNQAFKLLRTKGYSSLARKYGEVNVLGACKHLIRVIKKS